MKISIFFMALFISSHAFSNSYESADKEKTFSGLFQTEVEKFLGDCGRYPESFSEMASKVAVCPGWDGPYLKKDIIPDSWGRPYIYYLDNMNLPLVLSSGPDKKFGTADDIVMRLASKLQIKQ
jgi:Type II secretion system (T2SS), protein G